MKFCKKLIAILLATSMVLWLSACGTSSPDVSPDTTVNTGSASSVPEPESTSKAPEPVKLVVDMHGWMPTVNTEPTAENPTVFLSPQKIADKFMEENPHITIAWARTKPVGGLEQELAEWFTTQINAGTVPAIAFSWGTKYQDRGWYLSLDEYLDTPNEYIEGNTKWRDLFPEYLWSNVNIAGVNGDILAIPIALFSGPATGYYYNKAAFADAGITKIPSTWEEMLSASKLLKAKGYIGIAPWSIFKKIDFASWVEQFCIGPSMAAALMSQTDYNKDGKVDATENLRGVKAGIFNPVDKPYAQEFFRQIKRYYTEVLEKGWENADYSTFWNEGKIGMREEGMWALQSENSNKVRVFDYGVFAAPPISKDTTEYASEIKYTEKGPYQPDPDLQLNIMKDAVKDNPAMLDAAVKFLKFLTTPENISQLVLEHGADIGAVKGAEVPPILQEWLNQPFAIIPKASWPAAFTDDKNLVLDKNLEMWIKSSLTDAQFFKIVNDTQQAGADAFIKSTNVDTTGW